MLGLSNSSYKLILQIIPEIRYSYQKISRPVGQIIRHVGISYFDLYLETVASFIRSASCDTFMSISVGFFIFGPVAP